MISPVLMIVFGCNFENFCACEYLILSHFSSLFVVMLLVCSALLVAITHTVVSFSFSLSLRHVYTLTFFRSHTFDQRSIIFFFTISFQFSAKHWTLTSLINLTSEQFNFNNNLAL